jgi:hypothetical protein
MDPYISIEKESIEGESDDIFFETNKRKRKRKQKSSSAKPSRGGLLKNKKEESCGNSME